LFIPIEVRIDSDKLFGRHTAIPGNTGGGKSGSVAGLIQWYRVEESVILNGNTTPFLIKRCERQVL